MQYTTDRAILNSVMWCQQHYVINIISSDLITHDKLFNIHSKMFSWVSNCFSIFFVVSRDHCLHFLVALNNFCKPIITTIPSLCNLSLRESFSGMDLSNSILHFSKEIISNFWFFLINRCEPSFLNFVYYLFHFTSSKVCLSFSLFSSFSSAFFDFLNFFLKIFEKLIIGLE